MYKKAQHTVIFYHLPHGCQPNHIALSQKPFGFNTGSAKCHSATTKGLYQLLG